MEESSDSIGCSYIRQSEVSVMREKIFGQDEQDLQDKKVNGTMISFRFLLIPEPRQDQPERFLKKRSSSSGASMCWRVGEKLEENKSIAV
jgi:hypothetical protein